MDNDNGTLGQSRLLQWFVIVVVLAIAFALRLGAVNQTVMDGPIRADARDYYFYAYNLHHYGVYSRADTRAAESAPEPDAVRSPGYPLFLWAIWSDNLRFMLWRARFVQAILDVGTVLLVFLLGRRVLPYGWAVLAALLTAVSPHLISATTYLLTETLFTFLMLLALWLVVLAARRAWIAPLAGAVLAAAALTRPTLQFVPLFVAALLLWVLGWRKGWRTAGALLLGFILLWTPWTLRNIMATGQPSDPRLAVNTLHHGIYPDLTYQGDPNTRGFPYRFDPRAEEIGRCLSSVLGEIRRRFEEAPLRHLYWYVVGKPVTLLSWSIVAGMGDVFIYPTKASPYFTNPVYIWTHYLMFILHWPLVILALIGTFGLAFSRRARSPESGGLLWPLLALTLIYFLLLHIVGAPFPRYGIPLRPILYLLAVWTMTLAWHWIKNTSVSQKVLRGSRANT